jgi:hypothetical protein
VLFSMRPLKNDLARQQSSARMTTTVYWFVAAVFREIDDLAATLPKLRAQSVLADGVLILAPRMDNLSRLAGAAPPDVAVATVDGSTSPWHCAPGRAARLGSGLRELFDAAQSAVVAPSHPRERWSADEAQSGIYAQLWKDADEGANILVANVANATEQLAVARIFLRQNCERVLTHEIAARAC